MMNRYVKRIVFLLLGMVVLCSSCRRVVKEVPTGDSMPVDNVYVNPRYDHSQILNVLVLPIDNPYEDPSVDFHYEELVRMVLRNFSKFNYFNVQFDNHFADVSDEALIDLATGFYDRLQIGAIGQEYNAQAVMKVSIEEFRAFPPMRMQVKAMMVDAESGERVWAFDHVFDSDDANVINSMRRWWNARIAGGDSRNRFELSTVRPSTFSNFVFYSMAKSYGCARLQNLTSIEEQKEYDRGSDDCYLR